MCRSVFLVLICLLLFHSRDAVSEDSCYVIIYVSARHLDYSSVRHLCYSIATHPERGGRRGDVGHAWIYLKGSAGVIEGGHSGECGVNYPKYLDGLMDGLDSGYVNPVGYLWETLYDGYFQKGSGGHQPTYAARFSLTDAQYQGIIHFIRKYPFEEYALTGNQCASFVAAIAALAGCPIAHQIRMPIDSILCFGGRRMQLWEDPRYSTIVFSTPDVVEASLKQAVREGKAVLHKTK